MFLLIRVPRERALTCSTATSTSTATAPGHLLDHQGRRPRTIPLTQRAVKAVRFFTGRWDQGPFAGIDYWEARAGWDRARVRLGDAFKDVVLHTFRHTCASRLVQAGVDIVRVQKWLGHKEHQDDHDLRQARAG